MRRFAVLLVWIGALWVSHLGLAEEFSSRDQHGVEIRIPPILRLEVVELGTGSFRIEALPQGELTLGPGTYTLRVLSNTRWELWLIPWGNGLEAAQLFQGKGRGEVPLKVSPGVRWQVRLKAVGWR